MKTARFFQVYGHGVCYVRHKTWASKIRKLKPVVVELFKKLFHPSKSARPTIFTLHSVIPKKESSSPGIYVQKLLPSLMEFVYTKNAVQTTLLLETDFTDNFNLKFRAPKMLTNRHNLKRIQFNFVPRDLFAIRGRRKRGPGTT